MGCESEGFLTVILKGGAYEKVVKNLKAASDNIKSQPCVDGFEDAIAELDAGIASLEKAAKQS